jgi:uncharacterized protein with HEPN domain
MSTPDPRVYLSHVREARASILEYTQDGRDAFMQSRMMQDAVVRNLEIVGEAVKRLAEATKARAPDIPWRRIAGMRDVLIHDYFGVEVEIVWQVVEDQIRPLLEVIERLLDEP